MPRSAAGPGWPLVDSGAYKVQPAPTPLEPGSPSTNAEVSKSANEAGSSQNEMLFMRGKAMSGAPIISGTNQLPNPPIIAGMTMKKIMIRPCAVTKTFNSCGGGKICMPGFCNSRRMAIDIRPPITPATSANTRYIVPMSLWFVEYTKRRHPVAWCSWASRASRAPWVLYAAAVLLAIVIVLRPRRSPAYPSVRNTSRGHCGRTTAICCEFLLRLLDPGRVVFLAHYPYHYWHEGVILAAELGALSVIDAFPLRFEPGLVDPARDRVDLDAERWHRK